MQGVKAELYVILDTVTGEFAGPVMTFKHAAVAIRAFSDIASDPQTNLNRHINDHELQLVGFINDNNTITGLETPQVILTGSAWAAAREAAQDAKLQLAK